MTNMNKILVFSAITLIALIGLVSARNVISGSNIPVTGNAIRDVPIKSGDYQEVKLSMIGSTYKLEPSVLKKDVPVRMEVDLNTVSGCMRGVVIPSFGVNQYVSTGDNIIEFTPTKSGTFNIACTMNMGRGNFDVVDSDGTKTDYVEAAPAVAEGGSCGGSGSCGCGGA